MLGMSGRIWQRVVVIGLRAMCGSNHSNGTNAVPYYTVPYVTGIR